MGLGHRRTLLFVASATTAAVSSSLAFVASVRRRPPSCPTSAMLHSVSNGVRDEEGEKTGKHTNERDDGALDDDPESGPNLYNDFEELSSPMAPTAQKPPRPSSISAAPGTSLLSSLWKRQQQLRKSSRELLENWTSG